MIVAYVQFECEFRRFSVDRTQTNQFGEFHALVKDTLHLPSDMPFTISYTDPRNGDLLPITNDDNLIRAFSTAIPLLRLFIYRKQGIHSDTVYTGVGKGWQTYYTNHIKGLRKYKHACPVQETCLTYWNQSFQTANQIRNYTCPVTCI